MTCQKKSASSSMSLLFSSGLKHWHHLWHAFVTCFMPSPGNLGACCNSLRMHCSGRPFKPCEQQVRVSGDLLVNLSGEICTSHCNCSHGSPKHASSSTLRHMSPYSASLRYRAQMFTALCLQLDILSCRPAQQSPLSYQSPAAILSSSGQVPARVSRPSCSRPRPATASCNPGPAIMRRSFRPLLRCGWRARLAAGQGKLHLVGVVGAGRVVRK